MPGALLLGGTGALLALPAVHPAQSGVGWIGMAIAAAALATALLALVDGLRRRDLPSLLEGGAWAALAACAIGLLASSGPSALALLATALLLAASEAARHAPSLGSDRAARIAAAAVLVPAEASVVAGLMPIVSSVGSAMLGTAIVVSLLTCAVALRRLGGPALLVAAGAAGLLADRGGSLEGIVGLAALATAPVLAASRLLHGAGPEPVARTQLPELADRLADAVLRFDERLQLREWNRAAADLLGLDAGSIGVRAEDLLGVTISELPTDAAKLSLRGAIGGLEVILHRSGDGVVAVVRDPGAQPEAERLGTELRSTIEELLRARRTIELQRAELERSATIDPLTGLSSRGAIVERIRVEVAQARRYRHPLALVLLDVDGFSEVNRVHGLSGGDAVLREVALRFRLRLREADGIGRFGSDRFIAVLPHTDAEGAATFADALRHRLSMRPIDVGDRQEPITVSIGVATMRAHEDLDLDGLLARAQEALDSATSAGGDRIALDRLHGLARIEERREPADEAPGDERAV